MNKEEFISLMEINNEKLVNIMDKRIEAKIEANNEKIANIMDEKIEANNEKLANIMDEKIEANNEKIANIIDEKIASNNVKIADIIDEKVDNSTKEIASEIQLILRQINSKFLEIDEKFSKIDKRFDELEEKIDFNKSYFEKNYGQKIEFLIDKIKLNDQIRIMDNKELEIYLKHNQELLNSHDIRITNLEKVANSN